MPIDYRIDPTRQVVLTHAWGVLTDADILALKERLIRDPDFTDGMDELADVSAIERLDVSSYGVELMVAHDRRNGTLRRRRLAIVVPSDRVFGLARMYQLMSGEQDRNVGVFRSFPDAQAWLGAAPDP